MTTQSNPSGSYVWLNEDQTALGYTDPDGKQYWIAAYPDNANYRKFLESGVVAAAYVAPPEPPPLTTEQKIVAAGFSEGELEDYLVAKIQQRLNE